MKKKRTIRAVTTGIAAGMVVGSAAFTAACNRPYSVYGPPPTLESEFDPSTNEPVDVYGPPIIDESELPEDYTPEQNIPEAVYGPPEDFTEETAVPEEEPETSEEETAVPK